MTLHNAKSKQEILATIDWFKTPLELALFRIEQRCRVFPIVELGEQKCECKRSDLVVWRKSQAREVWSEFPDATVGVACRRGTTFIKVILDGRKGIASWRKLAKIHGYLHRTRTLRFGSKHYLYFWCRGKSYSAEPMPLGNIFPGILVSVEGFHLADDPEYRTTCDPILQAPSWILGRVPKKKSDSSSKYKKTGPLKELCTDLEGTLKQGNSHE